MILRPNLAFDRGRTDKRRGAQRERFAPPDLGGIAVSSNLQYI